MAEFERIHFHVEAMVRDYTLDRSVLSAKNYRATRVEDKFCTGTIFHELLFKCKNLSLAEKFPVYGITSGCSRAGPGSSHPAMIISAVRLDLAAHSTGIQ